MRTVSKSQDDSRGEQRSKMKSGVTNMWIHVKFSLFACPHVSQEEAANAASKWTPNEFGQSDWPNDDGWGGVNGKYT